MIAISTYNPDEKTLTHNGVDYPFYIGYRGDSRLLFANQVLEFASGKKTLQEVVENIKEISEEK